MQSIVISSKSVTILWEPPVFLDRNGPIVYYILVIREQQFNLSDIVLNVTGRTNYTLSSLEEYNTYSYQVAAATRVGLGPYSDPILFTTLQDGKYTHVQAQNTTLMCMHAWVNPNLLYVCFHLSFLHICIYILYSTFCPSTKSIWYCSKLNTSDIHVVTATIN